MHFYAVSIGSTVPQNNFTAAIQSVFESSLNLRLGHQDRLITILVSDHYDLPQGIRLIARNVPFQSLVVGLRAASTEKILRFESSPLLISLREASIWEAQIPYIDVTLASTRQAWARLWHSLNLQQRLKGTELIGEDLFQTEQGSHLTRKLSQPVLGLIAGTKDYDVETAVDAAQKMIGLGPGVTPTGDDILIGYLAGLWSATGDDNQQIKFVEAFGNALLNLIRQTNEISRTYLYHAIHKQFSSSLIKLLNAIREGEPDQIQT
ncbi:MAG TPA: DUF2877 domain-containing protein, partial [Anaerolineales bacterium]|nr:DUF2877 domain-containing protein [Anaerolineales bacterium]